MEADLLIPPPALAARIGGAYDSYREIGAGQRRLIEAALPDDWSFADKAILDFGCGTGRTLAAFADETDKAEFVGCDIHTESIDWANSELSPPFRFFACTEAPPLSEPAERFDLVYAMSVFTHITERWGEWLADIHRILRPDGLAVISVLGPAMAQQILGRDWDERIGMAWVDLHKNWAVGGPDVLVSEWWVRVHWGKGFEILRFVHADPAAGPGHDLVVLRRRETEVTPEMFAAVDPCDPREYAAAACNLQLLWRQQAALGDELRASQAGRAAAEQRAHESDALLHTVLTSHSWRITAPLRRAAAALRERRR